MVIGSYISVITLNINGLNAAIKRQRLAEQVRTHAWMHFHFTTSLCLIPPNCMWLFYIVKLIMFPLWLAILIIFIFCLTIDLFDKHLLLLWLCNHYSLNTIASWFINKKIIEICYHENYYLIEKPVITF